MSVMQINISDSDISGTASTATNGFHSKKSNDMDSLMNNLTKPTNATTKSSVPESNVKKTDFFGKK